jgi:hypothetical protein
MVSLIGVKGRTLEARFREKFYDPESAVIDRDQLHCAEVILEDVPAEILTAQRSSAKRSTSWPVLLVDSRPQASIRPAISYWVV